MLLLVALHVVWTPCVSWTAQWVLPSAQEVPGYGDCRESVRWHGHLLRASRLECLQQLVGEDAQLRSFKLYQEGGGRIDWPSFRAWSIAQFAACS